MHDDRVRFPVSIHAHTGSSADTTPVLSIARSSLGCQRLEHTLISCLHLVSRLARQLAWWNLSLPTSPSSAISLFVRHIENALLRYHFRWGGGEKKYIICRWHYHTSGEQSNTTALRNQAWVWTNKAVNSRRLFCQPVAVCTLSWQ